MRIDKRETTTMETWVLLEDVIALVKDTRGSDPIHGQWDAGWDTACGTILKDLKEIS